MIKNKPTYFCDNPECEGTESTDLDYDDFIEARITIRGEQGQDKADILVHGCSMMCFSRALRSTFDSSMGYDARVQWVEDRKVR